MSTLFDLPILRALRHRNFRLFFSGQIISLIGTWMESVAQAWLIYRLTGSSALLGLVAFAGQVPVLLLGPLAGHAADRLPRRAIILCTQSAFMVIGLLLAALTLSGKVQIWQIFVLATLMGIVAAFDVPARQSFLVEMVGREDMMNGIALNSTMFNFARVAGPAIAGLIVAQIGEGWCFLLNGVSYIAVIAGLAMIRLGPLPERPPSTTSPWQNIRDGYAFIGQNIPVRNLLGMIALLSFAGLPFIVLLPVFAEGILHSGAKGLGLLMSASGVGATTGALLLASRVNVAGLSRWLSFAAITFAVALATFAWSTNLWLSASLLLLTGFAMMVQIGSCNTLIQSMVPDHYRGRVMSVYSMMLIGMNPLGAMASGFAAARWGAPATITAGAIACLLAALIFLALLPSFRTAARGQGCAT